MESNRTKLLLRTLGAALASPCALETRRVLYYVFAARTWLVALGAGESVRLVDVLWLSLALFGSRCTTFGASALFVVRRPAGPVKLDLDLETRCGAPLLCVRLVVFYGSRH